MDDSGAEDARNLCFLAPDALAVYTYTSRPFGVRLAALPFRPAAFWYSPKLGGVSAFAAGADGQFCPPADREEAREDWVLLLVDEKSLDSVLSRLMQPLRDHPFSAPAVTPSIR